MCNYPDNIYIVCNLPPDVCRLDGEDQYDQLKRTENIKMTFGDHSVEFTGRDFVRDIGMAIRYANDQYFNQDVCKRIVTDIAKDNLAGKTTSICIVTDVRFDNEVEALKDLGIIWRYVKPTIVNITREGYVYDGHVTENGNLPYDIRITNPGNSTYEQIVVDNINRIMYSE